METIEIIKNNKLIAEFLGFKKVHPNMREESSLSKIYRYPNYDEVFYEGLYVGSQGAYINLMYRREVEGKKMFKSYGVRDGVSLKDMPFDKSLDWLMPAVNKIEKNLDWAVTITWQNCLIYPSESNTIKDISFEGEAKTKIEAVFVAVAEFIEWYNNSQTQSL